MLTDIQRFSLHDGPGIRTTIFLKGCTMACSWCHNPETISARPQIMVDPSLCIGCGKCMDACDTQARYVRDGNIHYERGKCISCGKCADECFTGALVLCGKDMSAGQIIDEVIQDIEYYRNSGGGVTLTGGEALLHRDFCISLLKELKDKGISTALETCLNVPQKSLISALPYLDLIMLDIKLMDRNEHVRFTGTDNGLIKKNFQMLSETQVPLIVRTPVIPGVTDKEEIIESIAQYIKGAKNLVYYELLNYNPLGAGKYHKLDMNYDFEDARPLPWKRMEELKRAAQRIVDKVRIN